MQNESRVRLRARPVPFHCIQCSSLPFAQRMGPHRPQTSLVRVLQRRTRGTFVPKGTVASSSAVMLCTDIGWLCREILSGTRCRGFPSGASMKEESVPVGPSIKLSMAPTVGESTMKPRIEAAASASEQIFWIVSFWPISTVQAILSAHRLLALGRETHGSRILASSTRPHSSDLPEGRRRMSLKNRCCYKFLKAASMCELWPG